MKKKLVLGITGPFASGKSTLSTYLSREGWQIIDADRLGHDALKQEVIKGKLVKRFGEGILDQKQEIDRKILGDIVFTKKSQLLFLERTVHPWIIKKIAEEIRRNERPKLVIDAALLFKMGLYRKCDIIVLITAPQRILIERGMKRNGSSRTRIINIIKGQRFNRNICDIIINNTGNKAELLKRFKSQFTKLIF